MLHAIIVDDNLQFAELLAEKVKETGKQLHMEIEMKIAESIDEVLKSPFPYDIYFVDIQMPELSGIDLVQLLRDMGIENEVVFVSAYDEYMQESMSVRPRAFVRKENLNDDLLKALKIIKSVTIKKRVSIPLLGGRKKLIVRPYEILYCKSDEHYAEIHYTSGKIDLVRMKLAVLQPILSDFDLIRIHSRYIVNMSHIEQMSEKKVILRGNVEIPISRAYKKQVLEIFLGNNEV